MRLWRFAGRTATITNPNGAGANTDGKPDGCGANTDGKPDDGGANTDGKPDGGGHTNTEHPRQNPPSPWEGSCRLAPSPLRLRLEAA
jgi:hypothetical protein